MSRAPLLGRRSLLMSGGAALALYLGLRRRPGSRAVGYGPLVPDPEGLLDLPEGFAYRVIDRVGERMDDGYRVPGRPDGMAAFTGPEGQVILMRNHELTDPAKGGGAYAPGEAPPEAFDPRAPGAVTRVVVDPATLERRASNLVLCGTLTNCAGGPTPWGWLSCEENVDPGHGYVFLCDPAATRVQPPRRLPALGRCRHEAACRDPARGVLYLSEDRPDGALYRMIPTDPAEPFVGPLEALRVVGRPGVRTGGLRVGEAPAPIEWVPLDEPDPVGDTLRVEAQARGAALIARGEGITFADGHVFLAATIGGPIERGQILRIRDEGEGEGGTIEVIAESHDPDLLDMPDNLTMAPWGELFFCEDGLLGNFLRGLTADGAIFDFARNARSSGELAGVTFAPDGRALFVNLYVEGITVAITGPFPTASAMRT